MFPSIVGSNVVVLLSSLALIMFCTSRSPPTANAIRVLPTTTKTPIIAENTIENNDRFLASGQKVNVPTPTNADDHLVTDLPLLENTKFQTQHWAGLLPASSDGHKYFFYWLFAPEGDEAASNPDTPLLIWLNGGPACSSMDGLWLENGPFRLTKSSNGGDDWTIDIDEYSWHKSPAYVVYIDQPVGTGLSFTTNGKYPRNDEEVNIDFYYFLQELLALHSDKFVDTASNKVNRPLYFSGESHAGHYIPSMMNYIHKQNLNLQDDKIEIPLSGGAIGNGWFDPPHQYSAHQVAYGYGMVGLSQLRALEAKEQQCQQDLAKGKYVSGVCFDLLNEVVDNSAGHGSKFVASQYDQRKWEIANKARDFPPGHKDVESFLGNAPGNKALSALTSSVLEAIHASPSWESGQRYRECTDPPYNALKHQDGLGVQNDVKELLNANIRLLFFNGIHDLICNHVGNEVALDNLDWNGRSDYLMAKRYGWESKITGSLAGYMKEHAPLQFLKVLDSGHMVPMDLPEISLEMMKLFMYQQSFDTHEQKIERKKDSDDSCPICPTIPNTEPASCPICEDCPSSKDDDDDGSSSDSTSTQGGDDKLSNGGKDTMAIPVSVVGMATATIGVLSLIVLCGLCYCCCCSSRRSSRQKYTRAEPRYDLELPESGYGGGYRDDDDYDDKLSEREVS